jgi:hypothetical protein
VAFPTIYCKPKTELLEAVIECVMMLFISRSLWLGDSHRRECFAPIVMTFPVTRGDTVEVIRLSFQSCH